LANAPAKIAYRAVGRLAIAGPRNARFAEVGAERVFSGGAIVFHVDEIGGCPGLFEALGDHEGDGLTVARYLRPGEHRMRFTMLPVPWAGAL